jgi:hypothetical protein
MKNFKLIIGINFLIMVFYTFVISKIIPFTGIGDQDIELGRCGVEAALVAFQVIINLVLGYTFYNTVKTETGKSFFLSAGVIIVIGYSSCFALMKY